MRQTISKNIVDPLLHRNNYNSLLFFIVLFFLPFSEVQFLTSFRICGANLWTQSAFVLLLGLDFFNFSFCSISSVFPADFIRWMATLLSSHFKGGNKLTKQQFFWRITGLSETVSRLYARPVIVPGNLPVIGDIHRISTVHNIFTTGPKSYKVSELSLQKYIVFMNIIIVISTLSTSHICKCTLHHIHTSPASQKHTKRNLPQKFSLVLLLSCLTYILIAHIAAKDLSRIYPWFNLLYKHEHNLT